MRSLLSLHYWILNSSLWALAQKEVRQIWRNKQLIILLTVAPMLQLVIYGFTLDPEVHHLKMGVVDYANSAASQELISAFTENRIFTLEQLLFTEKELGRLVEEGKLTAGVVISPDFDRNLSIGKTADIQVIIDGVDANTAGIATGYVRQIVQQYSLQQSAIESYPVNPQFSFLYNPGLSSSWFFVPGVMGLVLSPISILTSAVTVIQEKDTGTLEQLMMTPANAWEILLAKLIPLFGLLMGEVFLGVGVGSLLFGIPFRGSLLLFCVLSGIYICVGIGIGIMLATISKSQQQVVLIAFFVNLPQVQLSGAIAPLETMPTFFRYLSLLNPLRHYISIIRGILIKGVGLEALWVNALVLVVFAVMILSVSIYKFRISELAEGG
jgi:ABC-2 type transport system permease protein